MTHIRHRDSLRIMQQQHQHQHQQLCIHKYKQSKNHSTCINLTMDVSEKQNAFRSPNAERRESKMSIHFQCTHTDCVYPPLSPPLLLRPPEKCVSICQNGFYTFLLCGGEFDKSLITMPKCPMETNVETMTRFAQHSLYLQCVVVLRHRKLYSTFRIDFR